MARVIFVSNRLPVVLRSEKNRLVPTPRAGGTAHDSQPVLLPAARRRRMPGAKIGFFLHIPFPAAEVFRTLPWRHHLLEGILGADLVAFHTIAYRNHFAAAVRRLLGVGNSGDTIRVGGLDGAPGGFPMGIYDAQ